MMLKQKTMSWRIIFGGMLMSGFWLASLLVHAEDLSPSFSAEHLLKVSVEDLRQQVDEVVRHNEDILLQIHTLEERTLILRQQIQQYENQKISLQEEAVRLQDQLALADAARAKEEDSKKDQKMVMLSLEKSIQTTEAKLEDLQNIRNRLFQQKESLEQDIQRGQALLAENKGGNIPEEYQREKDLLQTAVDQQQAKVRDMKERLDRYRTVLAMEETDMQDLEKDIFRLKEEMSEEHKIMEHAKGTHDDLKKNLEQGQQQAATQRQGYRNQMDQLQHDRDALIQVLEEAKGISKSVKTSFKIFQSEIQEARQRLQTEHQMLSDQLAVLQETQAKYQRLKEVDERVSAKISKKENLFLRKKELSAASGQQLAHQKDTEQKRQALKIQNVQLSKEVEYLKGHAEQWRSQKRHAKKQDFLARYEQENRKIQGISRRVLQAQTAVKGLSLQIGALQDGVSRLERDIQETQLRETQLAGQVEQLRSDRADRQKRGQDLQAEKNQHMTQWSEEVAQLKSRRDQLLQSLELAEKKSQARKLPEITHLQNEEKQLRDYWKILKRDHEGLLDKQAHLKTAISRLENQNSAGQTSSATK
jgi:chromosome segregation ATPase